MAAKSSKDMPGPDHYYPQYRGRRIKGGTSLTYTDIRFKYMIEDLPGPGDYEIPAAEKPICEPCGKKSCKRGKLHVGRVPYDLRGKGPSVPSKNDRNGFTRTPYGTVVKIPPDDHDETLGPAFYHPKETNFNTERYKGNHFGMMRGQRTTFLGNQGPGPGDYDIVTDKSLTPLQAYTEKLKFWKRKFSRQPRLAELVEINTLKENLPGPGKYNPPPLSGFDVPVVKEKFHNVGFSIGAKRFKPLRPSDTPAPCDTVDPRTAMDGLKKPGSVIYTGFLKLSPRFEKEKLEVTPGPASYTLEGISEEIQRKIPPLHIRALKREIDFTCKDIKTYPGPGYYEIKDREHPTRPRNAVFRSVVPREGRPPEPVSRSNFCIIIRR
ncbi:hypothetical protein C0J52_03616 [Blattella germanica]|nr:hypothetical protein C0J52_03616 [Blattella germanica]